MTQANYLASRRLVTPGRLREFFAPRSIAMVGASDNSGWARFIAANCRLTGFGGPLTAVHPKAKSAFGLPVVPSLRDLAGEPPDLAFILAPLPAVESVLDDMGAAGVHSAIVLASGYREVGAAGRALEDSMISRAIANDVTVLGPNCLGYLNAHTGAAPYSLTLPPPLTAGGVGIALQSGALASVVLTFAKAHAIGLSVLTSVGNESMMKTVDVIDYFVEDEATKVIALFLEEIGDPVRFAQAAARADAAGKPIVALKVGSSPEGQQAALAHTGSVAGDDAVVSAALRQMNIIRVTSLEELLTTAALLANSRTPRGRRMGVLSASGGACDIIADAASAQGIAIPDFAPATEAAIAAVLPPFASARNPLDVTGYGGLANLGTRTARAAIDVALDAAADDPNLDFILYTGLTLPAVRPPDEAMATMMESKLDWFAQRVASSPVPVIPVSSTCVDLAGYGREQLTSRGLYQLPGLNGSIAAIGNALRWAENRGSWWAAADAMAALDTAQATTTGHAAVRGEGRVDEPAGQTEVAVRFRLPEQPGVAALREHQDRGPGLDVRPVRARGDERRGAALVGVVQPVDVAAQRRERQGRQQPPRPRARRPPPARLRQPQRDRHARGEEREDHEPRRVGAGGDRQAPQA